MTAIMSSRMRMLSALERQEVDRVPCSFMMFGGLKLTCRDYEEFVERQVQMGLDTFVEIPPRPPIVANDHYNLHGLPVSYGREVTVAEWVDHPEGDETPVLVKEYRTPSGTLRAEVRKTADWRWGDHVPFLDDYVIPRSRKFLVAEEADLDALAHLLVPPTPHEIASFKSETACTLALARREELLVTGGWGVGADLIGWVCGLQNMMYMVYDQPEFLRRLLTQVALWNRMRMEIVLDAGIDLYIKRAWYENLDFWSPSTWREFLLPILEAEVALAHDRGAKFGYLITSNCMDLLELITDAGVDVVIGVDPHMWDLERTKKIVDGRICLWGGVNGHSTLETGSAQAVRGEVRRALEILGGEPGFILSPVDNVRDDTPRARKNVAALIDEWRALSLGEPLEKGV